MTFFSYICAQNRRVRNFGSGERRGAGRFRHIKKGVIEILSSFFKLGRLNTPKIRLAIALHRMLTSGRDWLEKHSGVGLLFYPG